MNISKKIDTILQELYLIDPALKTREGELKLLISKLIELKPDTKFDEEFAVRLREELALRPIGNSKQSFFSMPFMKVASITVPAFAVLLLFVLPFVSEKQAGVFSVSVTDVGRIAFGDIVYPGGNADSFGGATIDGVAESSGVAFDASVSMVADISVPEGRGGGISEKMIEPPQSLSVRPQPESIDLYQFTYAGETIPELTAEGFVYKRVAARGDSSRLISALKNTNLGFLSLGSFDELKVRTFSVFEDKDFGYEITAHIEEGSLYIGPNWSRWNSHKDGDVRQPAAEIIPSERAIDIADAFLREYAISRANFGDPTVRHFGAEVVAYDDMSLSKETMPAVWMPEAVSVVYPLVIDESVVIDEGGYPFGMNVMVNVPYAKVSNVENLSTHTYERSAYPLIDDWNTVLGKIEARNTINFFSDDFVGEKRVRPILLDTPTVVLMHTWVYDPVRSISQELLVPALRFPVLVDPASSYMFYSDSIMIPLVQGVGEDVYRILPAVQ